MDTSIAVIAIVAALALLGVVAVVTIVTIPLQLQQAEAKGCESSFPHSGGGAVGFNASQGRCFGH